MRTEEDKVIVGLHLYGPPRKASHHRLQEIQTDLSGVDWTERIYHESYKPMLDMGVLQAATFDLYPTLRVELDRVGPETRLAMERHMKSNGVASPSIHVLLPDLSRPDKEIVIGAGIDEFRAISGENPRFFWPPETALDTETLQVLQEHGIEGVFCSPSQVELKDGGDPNNLPTRMKLLNGRSILLTPYDGPLSHSLAFDDDPNDPLRADAYKFRDRIVKPRLLALQNGFPLVGYTDGETFGHHMRWGVAFIDTLLTRALPEAGIKVVSINNVDMDKVSVADGQIKEKSAWSCSHGSLARWHGNCNCGAEWTDVGWKKPFYGGLHEMNAGVTSILEGALGKNYAELVRKDFAEAYRSTGLSGDSKKALIAAKTSALTALTSCGTFFSDPGVSGNINILFARQAVEHLKDAGLAKDARRLWSNFLNIMRKVNNPYNNKEGVDIVVDLLGKEIATDGYSTFTR